jgi:uncharacterized SAM-dependent methyltransferase
MLLNNMDFQQLLLKELVKRGYEERDGKKVWNLANRSLLHKTPELSKAFMALSAHPRYRATIIDIEKELIKKHAEEFVSEVGDHSFNLIDMGCGDGGKAIEFMKALGGDVKVRYCAVSPGNHTPKIAVENMKKKNFENLASYLTITSDLDEVGEIADSCRDEEFRKNVILLFGSTLASFEIHDYLFNLSNAMEKGEIVIIGNGIRKGERLQNLENYKHELIRQWLMKFVEGLGFNEEDGELEARFSHGRVEGAFKVKKGKAFKHDGKDIVIQPGDEILVAVLYKYFEEELENICKKYFSEVKLKKDEMDEYALILCKK